MTAILEKRVYKSLNVINWLQAPQTQSFESAGMLQTVLVRDDVCELVSCQVIKCIVLLIS